MPWFSEASRRIDAVSPESKDLGEKCIIIHAIMPNCLMFRLINQTGKRWENKIQTGRQ